MQPSGPTLPQSLPTFPLPSLEQIVAVGITIVFIWWLVFTVVVFYHWFRYARDSWLTVPILALHLAISGWIFVFATGALH